MSEPDLSEFEELAQTEARQCKVGDALERLSKEDAEALTAALARRDLPPKSLIAWLERRGVTDMHYNSIAYHRTGKCKCG